MANDLICPREGNKIRCMRDLHAGGRIVKGYEYIIAGVKSYDIISPSDGSVERVIYLVALVGVDGWFSKDRFVMVDDSLSLSAQTDYTKWN